MANIDTAGIMQWLRFGRSGASRIFGHVEIEYELGQLYMYVEGRPLKTQALTRWNLIGRSIIATQPVSSPSSILPPLTALLFPQGNKFSAFLKKSGIM
jgi:hypothetical protein